jgi:deoxyribonuclease (pyrimidine dimer)
MTRINCIEPKLLYNKHLFIEYRELPRVFNLARRLSSYEKVPSYTMGTGHVKFFYDKLEYLINRQKLLVDELLGRGYRLSHPNPEALRELNSCAVLYNNWTPTLKDKEVNLKRLLEKNPYYYNKVILQ